MRAVLIFLSFLAIAFCAPIQFTKTIQVDNLLPGQIYYTSSDADYFSLGNIENPLSVQIEFLAGDASTEASICLVPNQKNYPVAGNSLEHACPEGGFVTAENVTASAAQPAKLKFTRQNSSLRGQFLSKMVEDTENGVEIYGFPTGGQETAGFVITTNSETNATFILTLSGSYCADGEYPVNDTCYAAADVTTGGQSFEVPAGSWAFYTFTTPIFSPTTVNQVSIDVNVTSNVYVQRGYIPTPTWNLGEDFTIINTPGTTSSGEVYYIGFDNTASTTALPVFLNVTNLVCAAGLVGPGCVVNTTVSNSTTDGSTVIYLDASLSSTNNGAPIAYDLSDSDNEFAYFALQNLPTFANQTDNGFPYYVRVSVGNNELGDDDDNAAPTLYAKLGGYPSPQSNDYAISGGVANQAFLPVESATDKWYIAVPLPADFSIWVGVNCAGNCSENAHGACYCSDAAGNQVECNTLANSTDYYALYATLPVSTVESAGSCTCDDDDYANSFDCSQKSSPTVLFIVLIVIGGLIILFVAIGVPLYCYISNKRKERYERI